MQPVVLTLVTAWVQVDGAGFYCGLRGRVCSGREEKSEEDRLYVQRGVEDECLAWQRQAEHTSEESGGDVERRGSGVEERERRRE